VVEIGLSPFPICYYNQIHWPICESEGGEIEIFVELLMYWDEFELVGWKAC